MWIFPGQIWSLIGCSFLISLLVVKLKVIKTKKQKLFINFILMYFLILISAFGFEFYIEYKLSTFDVDNDGFFSPSEQSLIQQKYFNLSMNDTGRSLSPLTGGIYSLIHTSVLYMYFRIKNI